MRLLLILCLSSTSLSAFGWGERGHHVLCEAATRLVKEPNLKAFWESRAHLAGHVCNVPDIHWRNIPENTKVCDSSHFLDPELLGYRLETVPLDFGAISQEKQMGKEEVAVTLGSLWWRADQFYRRALTNAQWAAQTPAPQTKSETFDDKFPYNQAVYGMLTDMALMGHFVGDASVPYHNTADYDGWETGRGGIHSYYESQSVSAMGITLVAEVLREAERRRPVACPCASPMEQVRAVSLVSYGEIKLLERLDPLLEPSKKEGRVPAKRRPATVGAVRFRPLVVRQLARSAQTLAALWDKAYVEAGRPDLSHYRSYRYPLTPELVPLDYTAPR